MSINKNKLIKSKKSIKIGEKIIKQFEKKEIDKIVISNKLKENEELINKLISTNIRIFDGRWLIEYILPQIVEYILEHKKEELSTKSIAILANNITDSVFENIKFFAHNCKTLAIVTNSSEKIKKIEENMYNDEGIIIVVANNKKKTLLKKDIIINFDFCEEEINKYNINNEATIINIEGDIRIYKKRFNGFNINDYEIDFLNKEEIYSNYLNEDISNKRDLKEILIDRKEYNNKEVYEALLFRRDSYNNINNQIIKDNVKISQVIGTNGNLF